jgi:heptosyltransferase-2
MNSNVKNASCSPYVSIDRVARIFLKPLVHRYRLLVWLADAILRPLAWLFGPRADPLVGVVNSILVFDPGAFGDMLLLAPFLRNLRACFPESRISLAGRHGAGAFLLERGVVDECIELAIPWAERGSRWQRHRPFSLLWWGFFRGLLELRKRQFDLGFGAGWGGDVRGNLAVWLSGARRRVGYGYAGGEFLLTDIVPPDLARPHVADRNLNLLRHIGVPLLKDVDALRLTHEEEESAKDLLAHGGITKRDLVIGVHPGAGSAVREWGDERFAEVAKRIVDQFGAKVLWFSDPAKPRPVPADAGAVAVALPFRQFVAVLSRCQLFICNDSGPMHVAAALKVPVIAVFGPQRPEWFGPYGEGHRVVIRHDIWCRPCGDICMWDEPYCLRLISVQQVMEAVTDVLKNVVQAKVRKTAYVTADKSRH